MSRLLHAVKAAVMVSDSVTVSFSGGKDSVVTLDLCSKHFKRIEAFFLWYVPGLEFQEETLRRYESAYGITIHRLPHFELSDLLKHGTWRDPDETVSVLGVPELYDYVRSLTGVYWIAAGERIADSLVRRAMIKASGSIDFKRGRFYPLAEWTKKDVVDYIAKHRLRLGRDHDVLGFSFAGPEGRALAKIKEHFPNDYEKIRRFFPDAEAAVIRSRMIDNGEKSKGTKIHGRGNPS